MLGILERGGKPRTETTTNLSAKSVETVIRANVANGAALVTEEHGAFVGLQNDYHHHRVNHSAGEYVYHYVLHTDGVESV